MGRRVRQVAVVRPPVVRSARSSPFDTARRPRGTVTVMSYAALSDGWWLPGYQAMEPTGWPRASAPSSVGSQPSCEPSGSVIVAGVPE
ncbi:hypothetical protein GCM10020295_46210 [Streptomyces cinereospinus]